MRYIVVGSGPAGVIAAETLVRHQPGAEIQLLGEEPEPPYSRMAIPYLLIDKIDEAGTYLRKNAEHFAGLGIRHRQLRVTGIDAGQRSVTLSDGSVEHYDELLIASGSHPVSPPIPGIDLPGVSACWTLADARAIAARARNGANVVLMGAGFIGCIILEALASRGVNLTVVEMAERMVPRMMNDKASGLLKDWCGSRGVTVLTGARVEAIEQSGEALAVRLADGQSLPADLVISATGVRANVGFLDGAGIDIGDGIKVDRHLRSSDPHIYAAGDCAQGLDFSTGQYSVQAIQPTAADHGRIAALNMAGRVTRHHGCVNMNVLDTLGLISSSFGSWMGETGGDSAEAIARDRYQYLNLQFQEDRLVGASSLGLTAHVGVLRGLIEGSVQLGGWKQRLMDAPNRIMEAYVACTRV